MAKKKSQSETLSSMDTPSLDDASIESNPASPPTSTKPKFPPWHIYVAEADDSDIIKRYSRESKRILDGALTSNPDTCFLCLLDSGTSISTFELDQIYQSLTKHNPARDKDVTLFLQSPGGSIEPAYQISKICKAYAKTKFRVVVPRYAKSAATLISIGADEIHMGPLSHLGPIDPQIGGLPALGVSRALTTIAELAETHPGSAEMFANYLNRALTVEQIGYCERISESAEQYAELLLSNKTNLPRKAALIARELVHEYKDHGFVIDFDEAQKHLGTDWIVYGSELLNVGERLYRLYEIVNMFLGMRRRKRLLVTGDVEDSVIIMDIR